MTEPVKVTVFGLGFVGLPLALSFAMRGCKVYGVDVNEELIFELKAGITHHLEAYHSTPIQKILKDQLAAGRFLPTIDASEALTNSDNFIVTVGIPVKDGRADYSHIEAVSKTIARGLKPNDLVLIRSTVVPGTTRNVIKPILEELSGLKADEDFYLAYSSERIAEGRAFEEFENMPTLVSGLDRASRDRAAKLLSIVTKADLISCSSMEVVETAKVMENVSRDVNIAMVNEFAQFTRALGIDIFEVIKAANTHTRVNLLLPGPGVGGYCIPNAFHYLAPKAEELGVNLNLTRMAREINEQVPERVVTMIKRNLTPDLPPVVTVFGLAMKDYSNDDRISPAIRIVQLLQKEGITVQAYDPAVPTRYDFKKDSMEEALAGAQGIVVLAKQEGIDFHNYDLFRSQLVGERPFIVDTRNVYRREMVEASGLVLETI